METDMTYNQIYKALMSEEIEVYVPDGVSLSHPVVDFREGRIVDCFLLFSFSHDGTKYTVPTARIIIDSKKKELIDFKTTDEKPFSVCDGTEYFIINNTNNVVNADIQTIENEYQMLYMSIREIAFKPFLSNEEKIIVKQYLKSLKSVELNGLYPFFG